MGSDELQDLRYDVVDHVGVVTFARPDRLNAFRAGTLREFVAVLDRVDADDDVRAVIVTGEGRAFCAGRRYLRWRARIRTDSRDG